MRAGGAQEIREVRAGGAQEIRDGGARKILEAEEIAEEGGEVVAEETVVELIVETRTCW